MRTLCRWREFVKQYGVSGLVKHLAARASSPVFEQATLKLLVLRSLDVSHTSATRLLIRPVTPQEVEHNQWVTHDWKRRLARGDSCYMAWVDGDCVHYSWVSRMPSYLGEIHRWLDIQPDEAYVYDCFTDAAFRGQQIFPAVLTAISRKLFAQGVKKVWIAAESHNRSSLRAISRLPFGQ